MTVQKKKTEENSRSVTMETSGALTIIASVPARALAVVLARRQDTIINGVLAVWSFVFFLRAHTKTDPHHKKKTHTRETGKPLDTREYARRKVAHTLITG